MKAGRSTTSPVRPSPGQAAQGEKDCMSGNLEEELLKLQYRKAHYRELEKRLLQLEAQVALSNKIEGVLMNGNWGVLHEQ